jgi:hypothetical protein
VAKFNNNENSTTSNSQHYDTHHFMLDTTQMAEFSASMMSKRGEVIQLERKNLWNNINIKYL